MLLSPLRWALRILSLLLAAVVLYFAVTLVQVWLTSRHYDPHPAGAIVVMGAAQDNGRPTKDLAARLNEALILYRAGYAKIIMVTGNWWTLARMLETAGVSLDEGKIGEHGVAKDGPEQPPSSAG